MKKNQGQEGNKVWGGDYCTQKSFRVPGVTLLQTAGGVTSITRVVQHLQRWYIKPRPQSVLLPAVCMVQGSLGPNSPSLQHPEQPL